MRPFKKCKFTIEFEADLDAVRGWGYEPEDWHNLAVREFERQSHYNTKGGQAPDIACEVEKSADSPTATIEALKAWVAPLTDPAIVSTTLILIRSINPKRPASLSQIAENTAHWEAAVRAGR